MKFSRIKFRFFQSILPKLIPYLKLMGLVLTGFYNNKKKDLILIWLACV